MSVYLYLGDIVHMKTDAIVNAANTELTRCPGICEAIFAAADGEELERACRKYRHCKIGHAVVTPGCGLPARYIIHVAGAEWSRGIGAEQMAMRQCYRSALAKAAVYGCKTVAIPLIFSGDCHFPRSQSLKIAGEAIERFAASHPHMDVILVLYRPGVYRMAQGLLGWPEYRDSD